MQNNMFSGGFRPHRMGPGPNIDIFEMLHGLGLDMTLWDDWFHNDHAWFVRGELKNH